jgi:hypothetical protein
MTDESFIGQILETFQLLLEPLGHFFIDPRLRRKQTDHNHLTGPFADGPAKKTGVAFVQNIHNPVIVDVFAAFADFISTSRAKGNLFGNRLITFGAESHNFFKISEGPKVEMYAEK